MGSLSLHSFVHIAFLVIFFGYLEGKVTDPHREPSKCEVCKFVANELQETMAETGRSSDVLHLGHRIDQPKRNIKYKNSELRLLEVMDEVCPKILQYNIHAERQASRRFSKGRSETMSTLHGLVDKGVKVELGIPFEMWDEPSAAVTKMKQYCDTLLETHEESIDNWFFKTDQEKPLSEYLCRERALPKEETTCLDEEWTGQEKVDYTKEAEEEREEEEQEEKAKTERKKKKEKEEREKRKKQKEKEKQKKKGKKGGEAKGEEEDPLDYDEDLQRKKEMKRREKERMKEYERRRKMKEREWRESDEDITRRLKRERKRRQEL